MTNERGTVGSICQNSGQEGSLESRGKGNGTFTSSFTGERADTNTHLVEVQPGAMTPSAANEGVTHGKAPVWTSTGWLHYLCRPYLFLISPGWPRALALVRARIISPKYQQNGQILHHLAEKGVEGSGRSALGNPGCYHGTENTNK